MARSWLITGRGVANKVRNVSHCSNRQISELGAEARRECPNCKYLIDNSDVGIQWPGLPLGVKFDPSDLELLEHLEQKIGLGGSKPNMFIDEFISTIENDEGIYYSHPENLPGMMKDGRCVHFFHIVSNAYGCGQRKRRKISNSDYTTSDEHLRWHKTGKSKAVYHNGVIKGWKKIMVLHRSSQTVGKPGKTDWVMHQYHLGLDDEEKVGEFVVSKIFYQLKTKQMEKCETETPSEEYNACTASVGPKTPKVNAPKLCRRNNSPCEIGKDDAILQDQEGEPYIPIVSLKDGAENPSWCNVSQAGEVAPKAPSSLEESLCCHEVFDSFFHETLIPSDGPIFSQGRNEALNRSLNALCGLPDLDHVDLGSLPEIQLADVPFTSQESIGSWLDRI